MDQLGCAAGQEERSHQVCWSEAIDSDLGHTVEEQTTHDGRADEDDVDERAREKTRCAGTDLRIKDRRDEEIGMVPENK